MRARLTAALVVGAVGLLASPGPVVASAAPGGHAAAVRKAKKKAACTYLDVLGRRTCVRVGAACVRSRRSAYILGGFDCVRRGRRYVFAKASPEELRHGEYMALGPSGDPTFAQALAAFDQTVADLPGVDPPAGTVGPTYSGTTAIEWLYQYRDRLTPAQAKILDDVTTPPPDAVTIDVQHLPPLAGAGPAPPPAARRSHMHVGPDGKLTQEELAPFRQTVAEAVQRLRAHGVNVNHAVTVWAAAPKGGTIADAWPLFLAPHADPAATGTGCGVRIYPSAATSGIAYVRQVLLHELTHCAQFEFLGAIGQMSAVPGWVGDGTAEYFAYTVSKEWNGTDPIQTAWNSWLRDPHEGLFTRQYSGVGWFFLLAQKGANIASILGPLETAFNPERAFQVGMAAAGPGVADDWGSTSAMMSALGERWNLTAPGVPHPPLPTVAVTPEKPYIAQFEAKGGDVTGLSLSTDIVHVSASAPVVGTFRDTKSIDHPLGAGTDFCTRDKGCACPDEKDNYTNIPKGRAYLGASSLTPGGFVEVTGEDFQDACKKKKPKDEEGGGGGPGPGGLQIRTLDFQLLGSITTGTCRFTGGAFVARGVGSGWTFSMRIAGAGRPGAYNIPNNNSATYVRVSHGGQTFSTIGRNTTVLGITGPRDAGLAKIRPRPVKVGKRTVMRYLITVGIDDLVSGGQPGVMMFPGPGGLRC